MKLIKIFMIIIMLIFITIMFILRIDNFKEYGLLLPTFFMYIFIPLLVILNLIIKTIKDK